MKVAIRLALVALSLGSGSALAQEQAPNRPITIISPYASGGSVDFAVRTIARKFEENTRATVVIETKAGGAGVIAANAVKTAPADGSTLFLADVGTFASNVWLLSRMSYDPLKDFAPILKLWSIANVLAVPADLPVNSVKDLVALAKSKPGGISYASQGVGASGHLLGSMLAKATASPMTHVPYRGAAPAITDLVAGRVEFFFTAYASVKGQVEGGKIKILAITSKARDALLPDVLTVGESGFPALEMEIWWGLAAPAQTSGATVELLQKQFAAAATSPDVIAKLQEQNIVARPTTTPEFKVLITSEIQRYEPIIKESGAKID